MTALDKFERLESLGLWRASSQEQRVEVIVSFGDSTLVISDGNARPLTHWSLAAVSRTNPGKRPAIFIVDDDGEELLEIQDADMIEAIEKIRNAVEKAKPKPGRLRFVIGAAILALFIIGTLLWLPDAAARYATAIVPDAKAADIGEKSLDQVQKLTGVACSTPGGERALRVLEQRLLKSPSNQLLVLKMGKRRSALLPGGKILLNHTLLSEFQGPEALAGYALLERATEDEHPPLYDLFKFAGGRETLRFLATGEVGKSLLDKYAEGRIVGPVMRPSSANLAALFEVAEFSPAEFQALEPEFGNLLDIAELPDPIEPLLSDAEWLALQEICG